MNAVFRSLLLLVSVVLLPPQLLARDVEFNRDILPILSNHCFQCHGPDSTTREAGLRLDDRTSAVSRLDSGATAIVSGSPEKSELLHRVLSDDNDLRMPPPDGPKQLNEKQVSMLRQWISEGARYQRHWAFEPIVRPNVPVVKDAPKRGNEIDRFVIAELEKHQLQPSREALRETLIRRVAFDLTGLPPTLEELNLFLNDSSAGAYETMVDRYLASSAYGEHMARHWLDLARYADTNGYQYDTERQQWVWRDWVIDAYNRNLPFDRFTIEQLAGDLLPNATPQQRLATGFNRNHGITIEGGIIDEEYRTEYVMDRLVTTGQVWMGLTIGCARCHDHKYDPISQREFYEMYSFFNQVPERGMRGFSPQEKIPSPLAAARHEKLNTELTKLREELSRPFDIRTPLRKWTALLTSTPERGWLTLRPDSMSSTGGSKLVLQEDKSVVAGGANPRQDIYDIVASTNETEITGVRLECLTHASLPGGGPGRHTNSNFVLSEFELTAVSVSQPPKTQKISFRKATADYSQNGYEIQKAIDGTVSGNNGWAVDGPTRKKPATALFIAESPFGFDGGTRLQFRLRHEAGFATHGIGRPRLSISTDPADELSLHGVPDDIRLIAAKPDPRRTQAETESLKKYFLENHDPRKALRDRISQLENQLAAEFPPTMIMQDMPQSRKTFVLNRGQYNEPTVEVSAGVPDIFPPLPSKAAANRLSFARWLMSPAHPLTARVAVNRHWQRLFGVGLVGTSEDFGIQGELPSHPELLDWLAARFVSTGWDIKGLQKTILMSATYRQTSQADATAHQRDPDNRLLARGPRMRLDAEQIRDAALAVSGLLVNRLGGRSVFPYQPKGLWMELNNRPGYSREYPQGNGEELYRRSMYTFWKRTVPSPMMKTLDAPEREFCSIRRSRTNTPLQALLLWNGPQFVEAARHLAGRMIREGGADAEEQIALGFRLVTARMPTAAETAVLAEEYQAAVKRYRQNPDLVAEMLNVGQSAADASRNPAELAAMTSVARLLLNLNEAITRG